MTLFTCNLPSHTDSFQLSSAVYWWEPSHKPFYLSAMSCHLMPYHVINHLGKDRCLVESQDTGRNFVNFCCLSVCLPCHVKLCHNHLAKHRCIVESPDTSGNGVDFCRLPVDCMAVCNQAGIQHMKTNKLQKLEDALVEQMLIAANWLGRASLIGLNRLDMLTRLTGPKVENGTSHSLTGLNCVDASASKKEARLEIRLVI